MTHPLTRMFCSHCGQEKLIERFRLRSDGRYHWECKDCRNARIRAHRRGETKPRADILPERITCLTCGETKPLTEFQWTRTGRASQRCHSCAYPERPLPVAHTCVRCGQTKPIGEFSLKNGRLPKSWCKACGREVKRAWSKKNAARVLTYARNRRITHPHEFRASRDKRYALTRGASTAHLVRRDEIIARDGGVCYLCGCKPTGLNLTLDHIIPVSKGGSHTPDNLRVACRSCNASKGARLDGLEGSNRSL